VRKEGL